MTTKQFGILALGLGALVGGAFVLSKALKGDGDGGEDRHRPPGDGGEEPVVAGTLVDNWIPTVS